jgi:hypothetical protein
VTASIDDVFKDDPDAHNFRSALFQTVIGTSGGPAGAPGSPGGHSGPPGQCAAEQLKHRCTAAAEDEIWALLNNVSYDTNNVKSSGMIPEIVGQTLALALQFGVHTGRLVLFSPRQGSTLMLGTECKVKGDTRRDVTVTVDIAVSPGLALLSGDTKNVLVPCDVITQ